MNAKLDDRFDQFRDRLNAAVFSEGREAFIKSAGIGTATLQNLQTGKFPWSKQEKSSIRQLRAWGRTATRVATVLGMKPEAVCEAIGLELNSEVVDAIEYQLSKIEADANPEAMDRGCRTIPIPVDLPTHYFRTASSSESPMVVIEKLVATTRLWGVELGEVSCQALVDDWLKAQENENAEKK